MGLVNMNQSMTLENTTTGVACNAIGPGWVLPPFDPWNDCSDDHGGCGAILHTGSCWRARAQANNFAFGP